MLKNLVALFFSLSLIFSTENVFSQIYGSWKSLTSLQSATSIAWETGDEKAVWVGTTGGLYRFETASHTVEVFTNTEGLLENDVSAIMYDSLRHGLWIGFSSGKMNFYDLRSSQFSNYYELSRIGQYESNAIRNFYLHGDSIFVCTDFGFSIFQASRDEFRDSFFLLGNFQEGLAAHDMVVSNHLLIVATDEGLALGDLSKANLVSPSSWKNVRNQNAGSTYALCKFQDQVFVGAQKGLFTFSDTALSAYGSVSAKVIISLDATKNALFALAQDELIEISEVGQTRTQGNFAKTRSLVAAETGTVFLADAGQSLLEVSNGETLAHKINSPHSNIFEVLGFDADAQLWTSTSYNSTDAAGFSCFDGKNWKNYTAVTAAGAPNFISQFSDIQARSHATYFGTWGGGILKLSGDSFQIFHSQNSKLVGTHTSKDSVIISSLAKDTNGLLWMTNYQTTTNPIHAFTQNDSLLKYGSSVASETSFPSSYVAEQVLIDKEGKKWISCVSQNGQGKGLYIFNDNQTLDLLTDDRWGFLDHAVGSGALPDLKINDMALDQNAMVWLATNNGAAYFFDSNHIDDAISVSDLNDKKLSCVTIDELNRKWFGSENGVWIVNSSATAVEAHYTTKNSDLLSNKVYCIAIEHASGKVYIGTDKGLSVFHSVATSPKASLGSLKIYPNPYRVPSLQPLIVEGLTRNASLKILSISGKLVRNVSAYGGGLIKWDGRDEQGRTVASGIYLVVGISDSGEDTAVGKVAVIRQQ